MNGISIKLVFVLIILFILPILSFSQERSINGIVKELHAEKPNFAKPLASINIKLYDDGKIDDARISKDGGLFSFPNIDSKVNYSKIEIDSSSLSSNNYIIIDDEPLSQIDWKKDNIQTKNVYILLCKKEKLEKLSDSYQKIVEQKLDQKYEKEYNRVLALDKKIYKDTIEALKIQHENDLAIARAYADAFSKMEFKSDSDILYKAFEAYLSGNFLACQKFLEDNDVLEQRTKAHEANTSILINSWLILAAIREQENDSLHIESCYKKAIEISTPKFLPLTYGAFANYLLRKKDYEKAEKFLELQINSIDSSQTYAFDTLVNAYYKLANTFSLDNKDSSAVVFANKIIDQKNRILENNNENNYSLLIAAFTLVGEQTFININTRIASLNNVLNLYQHSPYQGLLNYPWVDGIMYVYTDFGDVYDENRKSEQALPYYINAIEIAKDSLKARKDTVDIKDYISDLNFCYEMIWNSSLSKNKQLKYFQDELDKIKFDFSDTSHYEAAKQELEGLLHFIHNDFYGPDVMTIILIVQMKLSGGDNKWYSDLLLKDKKLKKLYENFLKD